MGDLDGALKVFLGFVGCGGIASVIYWFMNRGSKQSSIISALHKITQQQNIEAVQKIETQQTTLEQKIKDQQQVIQQTQQKIEEIKQQGSQEIVDVLKEESIEDIHNEITGDWDKI